MERIPRLAVALIGDVTSEPGAQVKYGFFLQELASCVPVEGTCDATLRGFRGWLNAARVFHPSPTLWKARFHQNVPAFRARSQWVARWLRSLSPAPDAALQIGVLFDALWDSPPLPGFIYTDYTAALSFRRNVEERSPFSKKEFHKWIALERRAYQRAAHIFVRSKLVKTSLLEDYAITAEKIHVVGGGVNFATLPALQRSPRPVRNLLFIGKDFYRKGGDVLLLAFARLREQFPDVRLRMLTNFPKSAAALPTEGVEVLSPTWNRTAIVRLYADSDAFILPSRLETWGDVLLEAMAYGLPCVGVEGDAAREIIVPDKTGFIVPQQRPGALVAALMRLCDAPALAFRMGQAGRHLVERQYTWAHVVQRMFPVLTR